MNRPFAIVVAGACCLAVALVGATTNAQTPPPPAPMTTFPEGAGKDVAVRICSECHPITNVTKHRESRAGWGTILEKMIGEGAHIPDDDWETLVAYLSVTLGKKVKINEATAAVIADTFDIDDDLAAAVVKYRTQKGPFKTWKDVAAVPGMDAKRVEEQKDNLIFTGGLRPAGPPSAVRSRGPRCPTPLRRARRRRA
jgi:competence ComEA-like helix-hairpin-helix protein